MRLPSGRFAAVIALYGSGVALEVLVRPEGGDAFRIRASHLRGMP